MTDTAQDASRALDSLAGWRVVAAAVVGMITGPSAVIIVSFGVLSSVLQKEYGWSINQISYGASLAAIMVMLVAPLQGWLVDRYGARKVVLPSLPIWALILFGFAMIPNSLPIFLILCALFPLATVGLWPISFLSLPAGWFKSRLGIAVGVTNLGVGIGAALVPLFIGYAIAEYSWRYGYAAIGLFVLLVTLPLCFLFLRDGNRQAGGAAVAGSEKLPVKEAIRLPGFSVLATSFFILGLTGTSLLVHMIPLLTDAGLSQGDAIKMQAVLGFGTMIGRLVAGGLMDYFSERAVGIGVFVIGAIASLILSTGPTGGVATLSAHLFGLVVGAEFDVLAVAIRRHFGMANFGRLYGLTFAAFQLGAAIGAWFLGFMRVQQGSYDMAMLIFAGPLVAGAFLFARVPPRKVN